MPRRVWAWIAHVVAWSLLVTGVTVLFLRHQDTRDDEPAKAEVPVYASMPFPSTLSLDGSARGRVGSTFRFSAEGFSDAGVAAVTLYDGARAMDTVAPGASGQVAVSLPALSVGRHTVHAAVTDNDGKVSQTAPMSVLVGQSPGTEDVPVEIPVEPGETPADVAERIGVPARDLLVGARAIRPTQEIPARVTVFAVVAPDAGVDLLKGKDLVVTPGLDLGDFDLTAKGDGCGVQLATADAEGKVTFFRGGGSSAGWIQLGRPQTDGETEVEDLSPGTHVFFARSGERSSGQVSVTVPDQCANNYGWTGDASIVDGELIVPEAISGAFVFLSVDGQTWHRIPASQDETINVPQHASIAHLLPSLAGQRLQLQVHRIVGDNGSLKVASGELRLPSDRSIASVIGEPSAVALSVDTELGPATGIVLESQDRLLRFRWRGASKATTRVRWQVLASRLDASSLSLNPPGLLASGVSEASGDAAGGRSGTFDIGTAEIPRADRDLPRVVNEGTGGSTAVALKPPSLGGALSDKPAFGAIVPVSQLAGVVQPVELPVEGSTVYVRVVTEEGPAAASPTAFVTLPKRQSAKSVVDFTINSIKVDAGRAPNPKYFGCLQVSVPWGPSGVPSPQYLLGKPSPSYQAVQTYTASVLYPTPGIYCPGHFPPPKGCDEWYCDVVEFIVDAAGVVVGLLVNIYSLVSQAYNGVISTVVDVITELNPICAVLGAAGEGDSAEKCTTVTGFATQAAITAVLASVGLPPSLPTADELKAIASGELDKLAVAAMKGLGVPCDLVTPPEGFDEALATAGQKLGSPVLTAAADPCAAVAGVLIGSVRKAAVASAEESLAAGSGLPSFPTVEGFKMVPDPRSSPDPIKVDVSLTVRDADADLTGLSCQVVVHDAKRKDLQSIGPYGFFRVKLAPTEGKPRTFTGIGGRYPGKTSSVATSLQGASYDVSVRPDNPTGCRFTPTVKTVTLRPADE